MSETTSEAPREDADPISAGLAQLRGQPQEQGRGDVAGSSATTPAASSEGAVQEKSATTPQVEPSGLTPEQVKALLSSKEAQALIFRQAQSLKDKEAHAAELRRQQEEERRRIEEMDDEEFGRHLRTQQQEQEAIRQKVTPVLGKLLTDAQQQALAQVSDEATRAALVTKANAGEYKTFPDFLAACIDAEAESRAKKQLPKRERDMRDAIRKEVFADQADIVAPDIGRGIPTSRVQDLHGIDAIRAGLAEMHKQR